MALQISTTSSPPVTITHGKTASAPKFPNLSSLFPDQPIVFSENLDKAYVITGKFGAGGVGDVYSVGTPRMTNFFALKVAHAGSDYSTMVEKEAETHAILQGVPHTLQFRGNFNLAQSCNRTNDVDLCIGCEKKNEKRHAIVTDVLPCKDSYETFLESLDAQGLTVLNIEEILEMGKQGLETLGALHNLGYVHGDIKPENIGYDELTGKMIMFDFGSTTKIQDINPQTFVLTPSYQAPELVLGHPYNQTLDLWSLAATLVTLYTGNLLTPLPDPRTFKQTPRERIVDILHTLIFNIGPIPIELVQSAPPAYKNLFKPNSNELNYPPSQQKQESLQRSMPLAKKYPHIPVWQARIRETALVKGEDLSVARSLITFINPMLRYVNRTTAVEGLQKLAIMKKAETDDLSARVDFT